MRWISHTWEAEAKINEVQVLFERAESSRRGHLVRPDHRFVEAHAAASAALPAAVADLERLMRDNAGQLRRVAELRDVVGARRLARDRSFAQVQDGRRDQAIAEFAGPFTSRDVLRARDLLEAMRETERALLAERQESLRGGIRRANVALAGSALLLILLAAASLLVIRRYTLDLAASRDRLRALNTGLEDAVAARTQDLRQVNEEIQRFAYIVSHDLRSPLVNVMGFTSEIEAALPDLRRWRDAVDAVDRQLTPPEARAFVDDDLPESIGFIRQSTAKMDRLINAILRLSREGRRLLTFEPLNMQVLLDGVAAAMRPRADAAGATVTIQWPLPDIVNDRLAMEQVFGNLLDNALKYLQPGRPGRIVVRGVERDDRAVYEVQDNGRGVDPKDHERVFELFRRAGVQDQPGEGIGLAHVRALVQRLGGTISLDSELDRGAVFRVSLPLKPPQASETIA